MPEVFFCDRERSFRKVLESRWGEIRQEYERINPAAFNKLIGLSSVPGWGAFPLYLQGRKNEENCQLAPVTTAIVESIPTLLNAGFAVLNPGVLYKKHRDKRAPELARYLQIRWNTGFGEVLRLHLPLIAEQSFLTVGEEKRQLVEGKTLVFDNGQLHEAVNEGTRPRAILLLDFLDRDT